MSFSVKDLNATIKIDAGRLAVDLERLKEELTKKGFIIKRWYGQRIYKKVLKAADAAAYECAKDLKKKAQEQTPVDTGALRNSAYIEKVGKGETSGYEVGYDKNNSKNIRDTYGRIQHEAMWFNHPNGGKAKFLEDPYNANMRGYIGEIKQAIKEELQLYF